MGSLLSRVTSALNLNAAANSSNYQNPAALNIDNPDKMNCEACTVEITTNSKIDFGCVHNFCQFCIQEIFAEAINKSDLKKLKCPEDACDAKALPNLIEGIVSKSIYRKYLQIRTNFGNWDSCPKCQTEDVVFEPEHFYGSCNECEFIYCTNCGNDYHGFEGECQVALFRIKNLIESDSEHENGTEENLADLLQNISIAETESENASAYFDAEFECPICYGSFTIGSDFGCGHTHCKTCVNTYLETKIQDGSVYKIKCPTNDCEFEADPAIIKENVSTEMFTKYDEILLSDMLAKDMPEIVYCPNAWCQQRIVADPEYGYCTNCDFRFCTECNQAYHGVSACGLTEEERKEEIRKYIEATENERRELERQEEEKRKKHNEESDNLIKTVCKKCPNCVANIQKAEGCHRMHCVKCNTNFCWLCLQILSSTDPYAHYRVAGAPCALFEVPPE